MYGLKSCLKMADAVRQTLLSQGQMSCEDLERCNGRLGTFTKHLSRLLPPCRVNVNIDLRIPGNVKRVRDGGRGRGISKTRQMPRRGMVLISHCPQ